jgi:hypothetical protein
MTSRTFGMNMNRMAWLLDVAERIPPEQFNMEDWFSGEVLDDDGDFTGELYHRDNALPTEHVCNTTACLAGWCGVDPRFMRVGYRLVPKIKWSNKGYNHQYRSVTDYFGAGKIREILGINDDAFDYLFTEETDDSGIEGKENAIQRVKNVIADPESHGINAR